MHIKNKNSQQNNRAVLGYLCGPRLKPIIGFLIIKKMAERIIILVTISIVIIIILEYSFHRMYLFAFFNPLSSLPDGPFPPKFRFLSEETSEGTDFREGALWIEYLSPSTCRNSIHFSAVESEAPSRFVKYVW